MSKPRVSQAFVERRLHPLADALQQHHGYRALWLDHSSNLVHSEPEDELERLGWTLVAVVMRPDIEELRQRIAPFIAPEPVGCVPALDPLAFVPA